MDPYILQYIKDLSDLIKNHFDTRDKIIEIRSRMGFKSTEAEHDKKLIELSDYVKKWLEDIERKEEEYFILCGDTTILSKVFQIATDNCIEFATKMQGLYFRVDFKSKEDREKIKSLL